MTRATDPAARPDPLRDGLVAVLGAAAVAAAAQLHFELPATHVPQTAQTFAVLVVGGLSGPRRGAVALALYLLAGSAGLPVFAGGAAGAEGAWSNGIEPFLTGALVKSVAAAIVVACARRLSGLGACRAT